VIGRGKYLCYSALVRATEDAQSHKLRLLDKKTLYCATKDIPLLPRPPQICGTVYQTEPTAGTWQNFRTCASAAAAPKTVTNDERENTARNCEKLNVTIFQ
jgi:hypothetical protein